MSSPASLALAKQVRTMSLRSFLNQTAAAVPAFGSRHVKKSLTESSPVALKRSDAWFRSMPR